MPNHVENDLTITGPQDAISALMKLMGMDKEEPHFDYGSLIPYPTEFQIKDDLAHEAHVKGDYSVKDGFNSGGYDWCLQNWGTKWNGYNVSFPKVTEYKNGKAKVFIGFNSAWAPPFPVIMKLGKDFPTLTVKLRYYERGMCFQGILAMADGMITEQSEKEYHGPRGG